MKQILAAILLIGLFITACTPRTLPGTAPVDGEETTNQTPVVVLPTVETLPTATSPSAGSLQDEAFDQVLVQAIENRDLSTLRNLMRDRFSIATFNVSLIETTSEEALAQIAASYLAEGSQPRVQPTTDIPALLGGRDPLQEWGPVANAVRALHVTGLGPDASGEAVLVIGQDPSSEQTYFHGLLVPQQARFDTVYAGPETAQPVDLQYIRTLVDVNLRAGPGTDYDVVGLLSAGTTVQVSGVSSDSQWWRIYCTELPSGLCWVSADPSLTEPTNP